MADDNQDEDQPLSLYDLGKKFVQATGPGQPGPVSPNVEQPPPQSDTPQNYAAPNLAPPQNVQQTSAPSMPTPDSGAMFPSGAYEQAYKAEIEKGRLEALGLARQQEVMKSQALDLSNQLAATDARRRDREIQTQHAADDLRNQHINPEDFWESKSTPQKVATAIGMIIAGAGAGALRQENPVMKYLDQQANRNIIAQKAEMDKKHNALSFLHEQAGDEMRGDELHKAITLQYYNNLLQQEAAKSGSPIAIQNAQIASAKWKSEIDQIHAKQATYDVNQSLLNGGAPQGGQQGPGSMVKAAYGPQQTQQARPQVDPIKHLKALENIGAITPQESEKVMDEIENNRNVNQIYSDAMDAFDRAAKENQVGARAKTGFLKEAPANIDIGNMVGPIIRDKDGKPNETLLNEAKKFEPSMLNSTERNNELKRGFAKWILGKNKTVHSEKYGIQLSTPELPANKR